MYSKEELEQWTNEFHAMVMRKRQMRKNQDRYLTRPKEISGDLPKIIEENISNADSNHGLDSVTV